MGLRFPSRTREPMKDPSDSFQLAQGFRAAGVSCGLKETRGLDVAVVTTDAPCSAAGVFTTNHVQAAPVLHDREILGRNPGNIRAVVANSGCANACTGAPGLANARRMAEITANALKCGTDQVLVLSTGVIGKPLDMPKLERGILEAVMQASPAGAALAARAILTTDTRPKTAAGQMSTGSGHISIRGFAKGAGMIHPRMATLLAVLTTDAAMSPTLVRHALLNATRKSFNRVSVDGDMSTNDTVLLLASGAARATIDESNLARFTETLTTVCVSLAKQIARDGEGATKLVEITVSGAPSEDYAHFIANGIACSALVKTAIHGADPNWGRILAAAGAAGPELDPGRMALSFGTGPESIQVVTRGMPVPFDEKAARRLLEQDPVTILLDLGLGDGRATVWTCDLSAGYVAINADYRT